MFAAEIKLSLSDYFSYGLQGFFGKDFMNIEGIFGFYILIPVKNIAFIPFADFGVGMMKTTPIQVSPYDYYDDSDFDLNIGISIKGGLMFTTSSVPGLYLQAAYKHNFFKEGDFLENSDQQLFPSIIMFGIGYSF